MTKNLTRVQCPRCLGWRTHRNGWNKRKYGNIPANVPRWYCFWCDRTFQQTQIACVKTEP